MQRKNRRETFAFAPAQGRETLWEMRFGAEDLGDDGGRDLQQRGGGGGDQDGGDENEGGHDDRGGAGSGHWVAPGLRSSMTFM